MMVGIDKVKIEVIEMKVFIYANKSYSTLL